MERIHVSVRARPLSAEDAKSSPWRLSDNSIFIPNQPTKFEFDRIFGEDCKTQDVYCARTRDIVEAAVSGFNGTVFAYGQTSSGKTHTMRGSDSEPGVIPLAIRDLFNTLQQEVDREFLLRMSYMEIYNEEINDLLAPDHRKLQIHESIERGIFVAGLREEIVASADQVLELMKSGESHRHVGETNMNVYSSRSHTIFRMIIESREKIDGAEAELSCDAVRVSALNLVDLAGSERAAKTGAEGVRLKEGSHINKSLMTLGTVIKKLSEGAESQGGHVPYRDSKLTRILQSSLGGNANTAIICNITLAQVHADETKSSLQFASRALRVKNCAHVNEIMTDAALLKRQKTEIEELRAKLQGLHSEHPEEEILNLRNTLLKSELERERIALELEEEKRAQAEREKRLQEQAKKIENLSSMVFCANREEESSDVYKKAKRRDTWCPGNLGRKKLKELSSEVKQETSEVKSTIEDRIMGPLLPFVDLVKETSTDEFCEQDKDCRSIVLGDCPVPAPQALLHVTSRRKVPPRKRSLPMESNDLAEMQTEYENLLLEFESHRITSDIQIDCLMRKLAEADSIQNTNSISHSDGNTSVRDSDAINVIKKLEEKITILEMEKSSSHCVFDLATEQTISAQEKYEKNLVDLAGSERAAKTGAEGVRLKEGSHINKSLMTLGTVIKKLSEGAESQGGHVPYRDSKLTRILQSSLGGNANTAIICNITLAQVHADETKSSLQFASRALRVKNCAHVNEIMTDAALLKRQKTEIEELRAKLQGLHSEHPEEEILNLRNTLLKSELERERIALELEEEKRAQAEREKRLQEQAKKIENLSSMVFCANREEESSDVYKKAKRRDTWCPGNLGRKKLKELSSEVKQETSEVKSTIEDRIMGPLLPFVDLVKETSTDEFCEQDKDCRSIVLGDCPVPAPQALLHVTSRRKVPPRKRSLPMESNDLAEMQTEYENLLLEFESHRITSDIQIDCLMRKLAEADSIQNTNSISHSDGNTSVRDSDAINVIKKLEEKITILEMEKSSSHCVFDLATEQTISAQEKYEKLYEELMLAREEATLAQDKLASAQCSMEESDWLTSLTTEVQEIKLEFENSKRLIGSFSSVTDELLHFSSMIPNWMLDLRPSASQSLVQIESIVKSHEKVQSFLRNKVRGLEDEKLALHNQASDHRSRIEELTIEVQNSVNVLMKLKEEHEAEKSEFICQQQMIEREISSLSSCSLAKEKESIRKELEKTKNKLKDMEFKLKNAVQEKTKLEGEKSCAERELKRLQGQKAMLERDMSKHESIIGKRRDSTVDRSLNVFDHKRAKGSTPMPDLEEYKTLEVLASQMEAEIASLEDQLAFANAGKDLATCRAESLASDLEALSDELNSSNSELSTLKDEVSVLRTSLEEARVEAKEMEGSLKSLSEEKEELSMQLTEALMNGEEENAIWLSKEIASKEAIRVKEKQYTSEIASLSEKLLEVQNELEICRKDSKDLEERLTRSEENAASEQQCRCFKETPSEANFFSNEQQASDDDNKRSPETIQSWKSCEEIEILQSELGLLKKERQYLLAQVQELEGRQHVPIDDSQLKHELKQQSHRLASMEEKARNDEVKKSKEKAKLRMRLHGAQMKLDAYSDRYKGSVDELEYMNQRYEEASAKLKKQLGQYGMEVLNLKKQLAEQAIEILNLKKQIVVLGGQR